MGSCSFQSKRRFIYSIDQNPVGLDVTVTRGLPAFYEGAVTMFGVKCLAGGKAPDDRTELVEGFPALAHPLDITGELRGL